MVLFFMNIGLIQPTVFMFTETRIVTVVVVSSMTEGDTAISEGDIECELSTCLAAVVADATVPPGMIACRQPWYAENAAAFAT